MKLRILGCNGGIGSGLRTTAMLLDHDILIDAGTGVGDLNLHDMSLIDHVFLTHSHLDHIVSIPFMIDSVGDRRKHPLTVHATKETLEVLQQHIFNWKVWPDFSQIPSKDKPYLRYQELKPGEKKILNGRAITVLPANHVVPAVGYQLDSGVNSLVFTGDTTTQHDFWDVLNRIANLKYLIIETAFTNSEKELAILSKHLCPNLLVEELGKLHLNPEVYISHLKPGESELTMQEIADSICKFSPKMLTNGQEFEF